MKTKREINLASIAIEVIKRVPNSKKTIRDRYIYEGSAIGKDLREFKSLRDINVTRIRKYLTSKHNVKSSQPIEIVKYDVITRMGYTNYVL